MIKKSVTGQIYNSDLSGVEASPTNPKITPTVAAQYAVTICTTCNAVGWLFATGILGIQKIAVLLKTGPCPTCHGLGHL
jgi:hypothetical protein